MNTKKLHRLLTESKGTTIANLVTDLLSEIAKGQRINVDASLEQERRNLIIASIVRSHGVAAAVKRFGISKATAYRIKRKYTN